ncbi:MAG TPA: hypothetical protein DEQ02_00220 [Ruminococcaceae bacterium]|nr:hypothetical protein [Oscillospiraceae bacterium]
MFGYIKANKPEMRVKEYELYKAVYCSLCRELGRGYGPAARLTLSYDFTFLGVLLLAMEKDCPRFVKRRCAFNPLVKCNRTKNKSESLEFTSAVAMCMIYYKLLDDIEDSGFWGSVGKRLVYPLFALARRRAKKKYPEVDEIIGRAMKKQSEIERGSFEGTDRAGDPSAGALAEIFALRAPDDTSKRVLYSLGYCIGKWVYLIDALDDIEDDLARGGYNPIALKYGLKPGDDLKTAKLETIATLNVCVQQAGAALELLDIKRYYDILANIIYLGLPAVQKHVLGEDKTKEIVE